MAKLERPEAVEHIDEILAACDAVMVARGDLGLELPLERVPRVQKEVTRKARARAVPVIVATQVLESMRSEPRPTRAEVSDAANAVDDGVDAIMLAGETAAGKFPVKAVQTLDLNHQGRRADAASDDRAAGEFTSAIAPAGRARDGKEVRIVDSEGNQLPDGEIGEIHVISSDLADGYHGDPERTAQRFTPLGDGISLYRTGYCGCIDRDGELQLKGRLDDAVKIRGYLSTHPASTSPSARWPASSMRP